MREFEWLRIVAPIVEAKLKSMNKSLTVSAGKKLPYANEIRAYKNTEIRNSDIMAYDTDLLIRENIEDGIWIPRVIVEAKFGGSVTTHDAIVYSHKAFTQRQVHPYLRYVILVGERKYYPLPGRLPNVQ